MSHGFGSLRHWIRLTKTERVAAQDCGARHERPPSSWDLGLWGPCSSTFQRRRQRTTANRRSPMCQRTALGSNSERIGRMQTARQSQRPMVTSLPDQKKRSRDARLARDALLPIDWSHRVYAALIAAGGAAYLGDPDRVEGNQAVVPTGGAPIFQDINGLVKCGKAKSPAVSRRVS
jgi:hypothetical protein